MHPERRSRWALRVALCSLLTLCAAWCAAESVSVSGKVVDTKGNPVPGVKVRLAVVATEPSFAAIRELSQVSGKSGEYSLGPVEAEEFAAIVVAVYEPGKWIGWSGCSVTEGGPRRLVVSKPTVVTGVVVDEAGKPMSGVNVGYDWFVLGKKKAQNVFPAELLEWLHPFKTMVTGTDGKYSLPDVPSHMIAMPSASKELYGRKSNPQAIDEISTTIVMVPAGGVTGRIVNPGGRPFPRVMVFSHDARPSWAGYACAGNDGVFRIDGVPPGVYEVACSAADYPGSSRGGVQVKAGALTDVGDIVLPASVELSGRVLDAETGEPIKGAEVSVYGEGANSAEATSGPNGEYKLTVHPGEVSLCYEGGSPLYLSTTSNPAKVTVPAEGIHGYDIRLKKAEQAHGWVLSAAGKPVAGAIVSTVAEWDGAETVADSSGRFTIAVPKESPDSGWGGPSGIGSGTIVLQAKESKPNGHGSLIRIKREAMVKDGVTITLAPAKPVSVSVVDKAGKPIAGAAVSLNAWVGQVSDEVGTKKTDKRGIASFSEVFKGGRYGFSVSCVGYNDFTDQGKAADSISAKPKSTHKIVMTKADLVKGAVVDGEGKPVVGATVTRAGYGDGRTVTTDARGTYKLFLAPKGQGGWMLRFEGDNDSAKEKIRLMAEDKAHNLGAFVSVERTTAIAKGVRIVLKPAHELQVIVKDSSGKPIAGASVTNTSSREFDTSFFGQPDGPVTDADGVAKLSVYEGMPVEVAAEMKGYACIGESQTLPTAGSKAWTNKCEIILTQLTRTVEGKVVDSAGKPVKDAYVGMSLAQEMSITTDAEGRFKIDLPDSMVSLSVFTDHGEGSANVGRDDKTVTIIVSDR